MRDFRPWRTIAEVDVGKVGCGDSERGGELAEGAGALFRVHEFNEIFWSHNQTLDDFAEVVNYFRVCTLF